MMTQIIKLVERLPIIRNKRYCILCGTPSPYFLPFGFKNRIFKRLQIVGGGYRKNCRCPHCGSLDRFRWCFYVLEHYTGILQQTCEVLHFAPEPQIARRIRENSACAYLTGDLRPEAADCMVDVTDIQFKDSRFDYIIINHVLEHISDEAAAMRELWRCLKPGGKLLLSVPLCKNHVTFEDKSLTTDEQRLNAYGQTDHCRLYGSDFADHLRSYGWEVTPYTAQDHLTKQQIKTWAILPGDTIFCCAKAASNPA